MPFSNLANSPVVYTPTANDDGLVIPKIPSPLDPGGEIASAIISNNKIIPQLPSVFSFKKQYSHPTALGFNCQQCTPCYNDNGELITINPLAGVSQKLHRLSADLSSELSSFYVPISNVMIRNFGNGIIVAINIPYGPIIISKNGGASWATVPLNSGSSNLYFQDMATSIVNNILIVACSQRPGTYYCPSIARVDISQGTVKYDAIALPWAVITNHMNGVGVENVNGLVSARVCNYSNGVVYYYKSTDNGLTWDATPTATFNANGYQPLATGFQEAIFHVGNNVLLSGHGSSGSQVIFRSTDAGLTWGTVACNGMKNEKTILPVNNAGIVLAYSKPNSSFSLSNDYGATWKNISQTAGSLFNNFPIIRNGKVVFFHGTTTADGSGAQNILTEFEMDLTVRSAVTIPTFKPASPAKLSGGSISVPLDSTGAAGTVTAFVERKNDITNQWESLSGVAGARTLGGSASTGTITVTPPAGYEPRSGEQWRISLDFQSADGTAPAPAVNPITITWTSDTIAPGVPVQAVARASGVTTAVCDFGSLASGSRHIVVEANISGAGFLPISARNLVESGHGYLEHMGATGSTENPQARNSTVAIVTGLTEGCTIQFRGASVDSVGNQSDWTTSNSLTLASPVPVLYIEDGVVFGGLTANVRVHLVGIATQTVTAQVASEDDTAHVEADYEAVSGTVTFAADPDNNHRWVDVQINGVGSDPTPGTIYYRLVLSNPVGATLQKSIATITLKNLDYVPVWVSQARLRIRDRQRISMKVRT